jgi:hypothetical protein
LGSGIQSRDDYRFRILPQSPLPYVIGYHGKAGLRLHGGTGGEPDAFFQIFSEMNNSQNGCKNYKFFAKDKYMVS